MPHQCLKCGKIYPDGSPMILRGCSDCGGTKFFYTEKALNEIERKKLTDLASKDMSALIKEIFSKGKIDKNELRKVIEEKISTNGEWIKLKETNTHKEDVIRIKEKKIIGVKKVKGIPKQEYRPPTIREKKVKKDKGPEVIDIVDLGVYNIDVDSLLEDSPVVIKRDGSYLVHLPSLFEKLNKKLLS